MMAVAAVLAFGCQDPATPDPILDVDSTSIDAPAEGGSYTVAVSTNLDWSASCPDEWVTMTPYNGKGNASVTVAVAANEGEAARVAKVNFIAGDLRKVVTVKQEGKVPEPVIEPVLSGWGIVGSWGNGWWLSEHMNLTYTEGDDFFVIKNVELPEKTEFKFFYNDDWKVEPNGEGNWDHEVAGPGWVDPDQKIPAGSNNIVVHVGGTYDVYLSKDEKFFYLMTPGKTPAEAGEYVEPEIEVDWAVIGSCVGSGWATDIHMDKGDDGVTYYVQRVVFTDDSPAFKIRANGSWSDPTNIGVAFSGVQEYNTAIDVVSAEANKAAGNGDAQDIKVPAPGIYDIYFNTELMQVYVMFGGYFPGEETYPAVPEVGKPYELPVALVGHDDRDYNSTVDPDGTITITQYGLRGWLVNPFMSVDNWDAIEIIFEEPGAPANHFAVVIQDENGNDLQELNIPGGTIKYNADFTFSGKFAKVKFKNIDWETAAASTFKVKSVTLLPAASGDFEKIDLKVEDMYSKWGGDTHATDLLYEDSGFTGDIPAGLPIVDAATKTLNPCPWHNLYWKFDPAITDAEYTKLVINFAEPVAVNELSLCALIDPDPTQDSSWISIGACPNGSTKASGYLPYGKEVLGLGFYYNDYNHQGPANIKIDSAYVVKK